MSDRFSNRLFRALAALTVPSLLLLATPAVPQQPPANFIVHPSSRQVADIAFADEQGHARSLAEFRGKTVLLNIWATWCGPCRREMPALDRLQARLGGERFQVVALSIDRGGPSVIQKFYAETGVRNLALLVDTSGRAGSNLGLVGLPGTLLIDAEGREVGRLIGPAEWDSPEMVAFLETQISPEQARREN
jgi:thiol-disulfide isomerase/thioredoxin